MYAIMSTPPPPPTIPSGHLRNLRAVGQGHKQSRNLGRVKPPETQLSTVSPPPDVKIPPLRRRQAMASPCLDLIVAGGGGGGGGRKGVSWSKYAPSASEWREGTQLTGFPRPNLDPLDKGRLAPEGTDRLLLL